MVFFFQDAEVENLHKLTSSYEPHSFGPTKAIVNGDLGEWQYSVEDLKPNEKSETYWDDEKKNFKLGDFNALVDFLISNSEKRLKLHEMKTEITYLGHIIRVDSGTIEVEVSNEIPSAAPIINGRHIK